MCRLQAVPLLAFVAALALVGCGGSSREAAPPPPPTTTARTPPKAKRDFGFRDLGTVSRGGPVAVHDVTFVGAGGTRIGGYLLVPRGIVGGRRPAVLYLHGSGGSRIDFLVPAAKLARKGAVTLTVDVPPARDYSPMVALVRRSLDVLASRPQVDPRRIGLVGYSLGAQVASVVTGVDRRPRAVGIIAGGGTVGAVEGVRRSRAKLFFQAGLKDDLVGRAELQSLIDAAAGSPRVRWYPTGHRMSEKVWADQNAWQARELGLGAR